MEPLRKIIVKKYLPGFENLKKPDLLTKAEYQLVNECGLSDLLDVENNPVALERICEGEKLQTAEFYIRQEKIYNQNVAKIYRKDRVNPPQPRITRPAEVPVNVSNATTAVVPPPADINADVQSVPTEDARQPIRSAEGNSAAETDPYQMREEIATVATAMPSAIAVTGDDNFGSTDVDGARDFLELCTGVELPPMSARQTLTREMLMSQFPSMPSVLPIADNFREINVSDIGTPMFKKPLLTSTPFVKAAFPPEDQLAAALLPELPVLDAPMLEAPMPEIPIPTEPIMEAIGASNTPSTAVPTHMAESSSSGEVTNAPPPRARRNRQLGFTERLPLLNSTTSMPAARRSFDVFSFQYHACWNEMVQDVQMLLLQERERMESLREAPIMREAVPDQKDSGFQQTVDERFAIAQCEQSNMTSDGRKTQIHAVTEQSSGLKQLDVLMTPDLAMSSQPNQLDQLPSLDKNLTEVSNPYNLPTSIEPEIYCSPCKVNYWFRGVEALATNVF
uniref:Uncharacterized protein n=1 Tax=Anopheles dirus TaxID=7168 RepID=A0A182NAY9_9DIPT